MKNLVMKPILAVMLGLGAFGITAQAIVVEDAPPPEAVGVLLDAGHVAPIEYLALSGGEIISVGHNGQVRWNDARSGVVHATAWLPTSATHYLAAPDGSLIAAHSDGVVRWWDRPAPEANAPLVLRRAFTSTRDRLTGMTASVSQLLLSHDGKTLAALVRQLELGSGGNSARFVDVLRLWSSDDGTPHGEIALGPTSFPLFVAFSSDDKTLLVADKTVTVRGFDVVSAAKTQEWQPPESARLKTEDLPSPLRDSPRWEKQPFGRTVQISPDGQQVLTQNFGALKIWNLANGTVVPLEKANSMAARLAEFSRDGTSVAVVSSDCACLWSTSGALRGGFAVRSDECLSLALSTEGQSLAVGDKSADIALWDARSPSPTARLAILGFTKTWRFLQAASDEIVAATDDAIVSIAPDGLAQWRAVEGFAIPPLPNRPTGDSANLPLPRAAARPPMSPVLRGLQVSPDGALQIEAVYAEPFDPALSWQNIPHGEVRARDRKNGEILWRRLDRGGNPAMAMALDGDGALWMGKSSLGHMGNSRPDAPRAFYGAGGDEWNGLFCRDARSGAARPLPIVWDWSDPFEGSGINDVLISSDGSHAVFRTDDFLRVVNLSRGRQEGILAGGAIGQHVFAVSARGRWLAAGTIDGRILLWDTTQKRPMKGTSPDATLMAGSAVNALAFSSDGSLAAGLQDGRVLLWKTQSQNGALREVTWQAKAQLWSAQQSSGRAPFWETAATRFGVCVLCFSANGQTVWSGDARGALTARDAQSGQLLSVLRLLPSRTAMGAPSWVRWDKNGAVTHSPAP